MQLRKYLPKGLFARSLIIIVAPVVILQAVVTYVFFERHWDLVTRRLSSSVAADIALLIKATESVQGFDDIMAFSKISGETIGFEIDIARDTVLPDGPPKSLFPILEATISRELRNSLGAYEFWFDTDSEPSYVFIWVQMGPDVLKIKVRRSRVYATNWHIFLVWMIVTSTALLAVSIGFLRNQVRPIQQLAQAAESFGKGRTDVNFKPSGAAEVRSAAAAFIDMRDRIQRQIEQRTEMLAGVSHDLRTPITRLKLELALFGDKPEFADMKRDLDEMEHMLEEYLAFAKGEDGEIDSLVDLNQLVEEIVGDTRRKGHSIDLQASGENVLPLKRQALKRCVMNLVDNAVSFGDEVAISIWRSRKSIEIAVDDNGPGIPEDQLQDAFKPFSRLDDSRSLDRSGVGLGLSIARDIARKHGGDIYLSTGPLGGLRAQLHLPT